MTCSFTVDHHYHISQRFLLYTHTLKLRMTMNETLSLSNWRHHRNHHYHHRCYHHVHHQNIITQHTQAMSNRTDRLQRVL